VMSMARTVTDVWAVEVAGRLVAAEWSRGLVARCGHRAREAGAVHRSGRWVAGMRRSYRLPSSAALPGRAAAERRTTAGHRPIHAHISLTNGSQRSGVRQHRQHSEANVPAAHGSRHHQADWLGSPSN
jgi:hypothetical protein